ncbi:hypothetical protein BGZ65_012160, partial [Modicella reniformis]
MSPAAEDDDREEKSFNFTDTTTRPTTTREYSTDSGFDERSKLATMIRTPTTISTTTSSPVTTTIASAATATVAVTSSRATTADNRQPDAVSDS